VGILAALLVGAMVGMWQGYWIAFVGIPAFIVTLAGMLIFRGATMVTLGNAQISPFPNEFRNLASGYLNGLLGGPGYDVFTLVVFALGLAVFAFSQWRARQAALRYGQEVGSLSGLVVKIVLTSIVVMFFAWQIANYNGLPIVLIILGALIIIYTLVTKKSVFGRNVYAIGGNLQAAMLSGIKVKWVNFGIFVNMGMLAALAGIIFTARLNLANPKAGTMFELDAIAACFIGGAAVTGGIGTVIGAIVGGLIMGVMNNGMSLLGVGIDYQQAIKGLVLLAAVAFDVVSKRRAGGR
jgi:putative multiple sugar transport system permease protein